MQTAFRQEERQQSRQQGLEQHRLTGAPAAAEAGQVGGLQQQLGGRGLCTWQQCSRAPLPNLQPTDSLNCHAGCATAIGSLWSAGRRQRFAKTESTCSAPGRTHICLWDSCQWHSSATAFVHDCGHHSAAVAEPSGVGGTGLWHVIAWRLWLSMRNQQGWHRWPGVCLAAVQPRRLGACMQPHGC